MQYSQFQKKQCGIAMITTLLLLIVMTLIVLSASRDTTMQLKMSSNLQSRVEALQYAQAGLDLIERIGDQPTIDIDELKYCMSTHDAHKQFDYAPATPCSDTTTIETLPGPILHFANTPSGSTNWLVIENIGELELPLSSEEEFPYQAFIVTSGHDNTANGGGKAVLRAGFIKKKI